MHPKCLMLNTSIIIQVLIFFIIFVYAKTFKVQEFYFPSPFLCIPISPLKKIKKKLNEEKKYTQESGIEMYQIFILILKK